MKQCTKCLRVLPKSNFRANKRYNDGLAYWCRGCFRKYDKVRRVQWNATLKEIKSEGCSICGYNTCLGALEYHHTGEKTIEIAQSIRTANAKLKAELENCILVCANCHREIHAGLHPEIEIGGPVDSSVKVEWQSVTDAHPTLFDLTHPVLAEYANG